MVSITTESIVRLGVTKSPTALSLRVGTISTFLIVCLESWVGSSYANIELTDIRE